MLNQGLVPGKLQDYRIEEFEDCLTLAKNKSNPPGGTWYVSPPIKSILWTSQKNFLVSSGPTCVLLSCLNTNIRPNGDVWPVTQTDINYTADRSRPASWVIVESSNGIKFKRSAVRLVSKTSNVSVSEIDWTLTPSPGMVVGELAKQDKPGEEPSHPQVEFYNVDQSGKLVPLDEHSSK